MLRVLALSSLLGCATAAQAARGTPAGAARLDVDLSEAPRRLIHARMVVPVRAGTIAFFYPKWIPGEHGPTGPIADLAGLVFRSGGRSLPWRRDEVDMYKVRLDARAGDLEIALGYLSPPPGHGQFTSGASITQNLAVFNWSTAVLYPEGPAPRDFMVRPSIKLPAGWSYGT